MNKQIMILVLVSTIFVGCNQIKLESKWTEQKITVDGKLDEWQENLVVPKNSHVGIGFMNDESNLYLTLTTMDRNSIMQALTRGFTVWIDPKGGKNQRFGIRYPVGGGMGGFRQMMQDREQNSRDFDFFIQDLLSRQNEIEVIGPGKNQMARFGINNTAGIDVIAVYEKGVFAYEMKIPLRRSAENLFAVNVKPGKKIGVGFTTPEMDRSSMRSSKASRGGGMSGGKMPGGGMGGGGGGMGGGRGGGRSGSTMGNNIPEAMEIWTKVFLSSGK